MIEKIDDATITVRDDPSAPSEVQLRDHRGLRLAERSGTEKLHEATVSRTRRILRAGGESANDPERK